MNWDRPSAAEEAVSDSLASAIDLHGPMLVGDPKRLEAWLVTSCPDARTEIAAILAGIAARVPQSLATADPDDDAALRLPVLVDRLMQSAALERPRARWAVRTWARAMAVSSRGLDDEIGDRSAATVDRTASVAAVLGFDTRGAQAPVPFERSSPMAAITPPEAPPVPDFGSDSSREADDDGGLSSPAGSAEQQTEPVGSPGRPMPLAVESPIPPEPPMPSIAAEPEPRVAATMAPEVPAAIAPEAPSPQAAPTPAATESPVVAEAASAFAASTSPSAATSSDASRDEGGSAFATTPPGSQRQPEPSAEVAARPQPRPEPEPQPAPQPQLQPQPQPHVRPEGPGAAAERPQSPRPSSSFRPRVMLAAALAIVLAVATAWTMRGPAPQQPDASPTPAAPVTAPAPSVASSPTPEPPGATVASTAATPPSDGVATPPPTTAPDVTTAADAPAASRKPPGDPVVAAPAPAPVVAPKPASNDPPSGRATPPATPTPKSVRAPILAATLPTGATARRDEPQVPPHRTTFACTRSDCGSVVASRIAPSDAHAFEMTIRMDDRSIRTLVQPLPLSPGTRVRLAGGDRLVPLGTR